MTSIGERGDRGQAVPLAAAMVGLTAVAMLAFVPVGNALGRRTQARTAADAAALAGAAVGSEAAARRLASVNGGSLVDSAILMAVVQRHFLRSYEAAWDDDALAEQLGLAAYDITRAQAVLADMHAVVRRARPPLGAGWWTRTSPDPA